MTDYIKREDALEQFNHYDLGEYLTTQIRGMLMDVPSADVAPIRHGKWIYSNDFHWYTASCNKCGYQRRTDIKAEGWNQWKFCPNCGAKIDEEKEDEL